MTPRGKKWCRFAATRAFFSNWQLPYVLRKSERTYSVGGVSLPRMRAFISSAFAMRMARV